MTKVRKILYITIIAIASIITILGMALFYSKLLPTPWSTLLTSITSFPIGVIVSHAVGVIISIK